MQLGVYTLCAFYASSSSFSRRRVRVLRWATAPKHRGRGLEEENIFGGASHGILVHSLCSVHPLSTRAIPNLRIHADDLRRSLLLLTMNHGLRFNNLKVVDFVGALPVVTND